ncbi:transcriptional regulator, AraC family [Zobellia uliginosa]|uniref:Transcriptional regulator, AraC family n=1 Tax=Zobellia uliginosa TaxID=143224 RepID=A0ABY1KR81_9FLAO|nr:helix-turn-helix transcriptional regulator [Zobellia uliginosa]SIS67863.1 transcriptional regulator, AraC family [Zobellia uliginosa]
MNKIPSIAFEGQEHIRDFDVLSMAELCAKIDKGLDHNPLQPHRITFFALLLVTEGSGYHKIDLKTYPVKKGSVLKIAKGQVHAFQEDIDYQGALVIFTENFILKYFSKFSIEYISHLYNYHLSEPLVENTRSEPFLEQLEEEFKRGPNAAQQNILAKILELYLLRLERDDTSTSLVRQNQPHYPLFLEFKNLVEKRYVKTRNVKDYAEMLHVSTTHLNQVVKEFTLNTAKHFIDGFVILETKRAIASTNSSLKEIAYAMGFDEVTNFTKFFKKHSGITPKQFKAEF